MKDRGARLRLGSIGSRKSGERGREGDRKFPRQREGEIEIEGE